MSELHNLGDTRTEIRRAADIEGRYNRTHRTLSGGNGAVYADCDPDTEFLVEYKLLASGSAATWRIVSIEPAPKRPGFWRRVFGGG